MGNHKSLILEYSSNFEKELVFEKISELCTELSDKNGLHIIVNDLNENGRNRADKITNNYLTWNRFNEVEKNG